MKKLITCLLALPLLLVSCQENEMAIIPIQEKSSLNLNGLGLTKINIDLKSNLFSKTSVKKEGFEGFVSKLNESLLEYDIQLAGMELLGYEGAGITVNFSNVGNKQLRADFVPNDFRNWFSEAKGNVPPDFTEGTIPYWTDGSEQGTESGMTSEQTLNAIYSAMDTWNFISCSEDLRIWNVYTTTPGFDDGVSTLGDAGFIQWIRGFGGFPGFAPGTILHGGNLPAAFFDSVRPNGGNNILGITFTYIWFNQGVPTDIDENGKFDVAMREIYINGSASFQDAPDDVMFNGIVDYETVVLHEAGHGLSQGHFGKSFEGKNGKVHYAPYALMNAGYSKAQREITATDNAGHCSIWEGWPYE